MNRLHEALLVAALGTSFAFVPVQSVAQALPAAPAAVASFDEGTLHVDRYGNGKQSLILIPGLGSGPWSWYGTVAQFSPRYTVYVVTLPGFDGRPATEQTPLFAAFARDFWNLLADRNIDKPILIGHSLGGTLCFMLAEQHPELLRAIVAVDGLPVFPMVASASPEQRAAVADKMSAALAAQTPAQALAYQTQFMTAIGTRDPQLAAAAAQLEAKSDPKAMAAWVKEDVGGDLRPGLPKVTVPVLVIMPYDAATARTMGGFSQAQGVAFYQSLVAGAPNAKVEAIAPARHFAMLDQPDAFYATVTQFLASLQ